MQRKAGAKVGSQKWDQRLGSAEPRPLSTVASLLCFSCFVCLLSCRIAPSTLYPMANGTTTSFFQVHNHRPGPPRRIGLSFSSSLGFPGGSDGKESTCNAGDPGSTPGLGRFPEERTGYSLQYTCLENSMDRGAWWATVHEVAKSRR